MSQTYEGKFRDFMVTWLARQRHPAEVPFSDLAEVYEAVAGADDDAQALTEVETRLGQWGAGLLGQMSQGWDDLPVGLARELLAALRRRVQAESRADDRFYLFFFNPF
jgi:hypothetical protein